MRGEKGGEGVMVGEQALELVEMRTLEMQMKTLKKKVEVRSEIF